MKIEPYQPALREAWNEFITRMPEGTFYHRAEWIAVTEEYYRFPSYSFLVREGNEIVAAVPLFLCRSLLLGRCLIPTPVCGRLNLCLGSPRAKDIVRREFKRLLKATGSRWLELRFDAEHEEESLPTNREHSLQILGLEKNAEKQWEKVIPPVKRQVRQGVRHGLKAVSGGMENFPAFYRLYASNMRDFGYPLFGKKFFRLVGAAFSDSIEIFVTGRERMVMAAAINFRFKDTVTNLWVVSDKRYRRLRTNNFLFWEVLQQAIEGGFSAFDFGRSRRGSGVEHFKKRWGTVGIPLSYQYLGARRGGVPGVDAARNRFRLPMAVWRRLPIGLTRILGPPLGKRMPL